MGHIRHVETESEERYKQVLVELGEEQKREIVKRTELEAEFSALKSHLSEAQREHKEDVEKIKRQNVRPRIAVLLSGLY